MKKIFIIHENNEWVNPEAGFEFEETVLRSHQESPASHRSRCRCLPLFPMLDGLHEHIL